MFRICCAAAPAHAPVHSAPLRPHPCKSHARAPQSGRRRPWTRQVAWGPRSASHAWRVRLLSGIPHGNSPPASLLIPQIQNTGVIPGAARPHGRDALVGCARIRAALHRRLRRAGPHRGGPAAGVEQGILPHTHRVAQRFTIASGSGCGRRRGTLRRRLGRARLLRADSWAGRGFRCGASTPSAGSAPGRQPAPVRSWPGQSIRGRWRPGQTPGDRPGGGCCRHRPWGCPREGGSLWQARPRRLLWSSHWRARVRSSQPRLLAPGFTAGWSTCSGDARKPLAVSLVNLSGRRSAAALGNTRISAKSPARR